MDERSQIYRLLWKKRGQNVEEMIQKVILKQTKKKIKKGSRLKITSSSKIGGESSRKIIGWALSNSKESCFSNKC